MSKIADYLRERLTGEVATDIATREKFSTDGSIFQIVPQLVIYPRTINDVRKIARFTWRLSERGQTLPLTARGNGSDPVGAAISSGAILAFSTYMSRILEFDYKSQMVRVQPGLNYTTLQEAMATHGLFLPVVPTSQNATIGGMLAHNTAGAKSVKYGPMRNQVDCIEVVLANGEVIQTGRLSKRDLSRKKGLQTMEGEIYRALDALIDDNYDEINAFGKMNKFDATGFPIHLVKETNGSFDLTPLFVGSQGALGITTQAILKLQPVSEQTILLAIGVKYDQDLAHLTEQILNLGPSEFSFIDGETLTLINKKSGNKSWNRISDTQPDLLLFVEFNDRNSARQVKKLTKFLRTSGVTDVKTAESWEEQEKIRSVRTIVSEITNFTERGTAALPLTDKIAIKPAQVSEFIERAKKVLSHNHIDGGIWGNLGSGIVTVKPLINLANLGQRQTVFKFMKEMRELTLEFNGSIAGDIGEGRLNAPFATEQYGDKMAEIFEKVKQIFDPFNMLNSGVKLGATIDDLKNIIRQK